MFDVETCSPRTIRDKIVSEIMKLVQPAPMDHKPSIAEIEKILNSDNPNRITLAPDGSAMLVAHGHTVGDIADAVLRIVTPEIERLEKLVFVPGMMRCEKCKFVGMHMVMRASDGAVGVKADLEPEKCPNGCGPLWRVSERDSGNETCDRLETSILRERALESALKNLIGALSDEDQDGLTEFAPQMQAARAALVVP